MKIRILPKVEPGAYQGKFLGTTETSHDDYGDGARWDFEIVDGKYAGATVSRTTKTVASGQNSCGAFCEMVSGLPLEAAAEHDIDEWSGQLGTIVVEPSPAGDGVRVASFSRDDARKPDGNGVTPF